MCNLEWGQRRSNSAISRKCQKADTDEMNLRKITRNVSSGQEGAKWGKDRYEKIVA